MNYSRFTKYWNGMQEADRILYGYSQTPVEKEKDECYRLLLEQKKEADTLEKTLEQPEMKDLRLITDKYVQIGEQILNGQSGTKERISSYNTLKEYRWILEGIYDTLYGKMQDYLDTELKTLEIFWQRLNLMTMALGTCMVAFFIWWLRRMEMQITRPVQELTAQTETIIGGKRTIEMRYHQELRDELDILNNSFYQMIETNNRNYDILKKQKDLEKRLSETKLRLLQSRVNPHFMFNTLNLIAGLAVEEDAEKTTEMLMKTAKYMRYALICLDKAVRLEEEISHAMDYMDIQKARFEERFQVKLKVEDESLRAVVPSMILQPLCENALGYGMEPLKRTTTIYICAGVEDGQLMLSVEDDGAGIEKQRLQVVRERLENSEKYDDRKGIGLVNTFQRLQSFYKDCREEEDCTVTCMVDSEPLVCTKICFRMPLIYFLPPTGRAAISDKQGGGENEDGDC
ncbi:MAG: sensor histidine kinase [Eubacteriales bacterium]|nr:sensor histidine kinase [Eubacteriales bacterium]